MILSGPAQESIPSTHALAPTSPCQPQPRLSHIGNNAPLVASGVNALMVTAMQSYLNTYSYVHDLRDDSAPPGGRR